MSKFVCYTLEGLMQQGGHQVWVMLGTYPTAEAARRACEAAGEGGAGRLLDSRIMSYFRSSDWWKSPEAPSAAVRAPHFAPQIAAQKVAQKVAVPRSDEPSIVA